MSDEIDEKPRKERKENADRRRRQLLDAARRSILNHGLAKTTLATVATEAGLSQGVAVFYFKSKAGLLSATLRDLYQSYEDHWMSKLENAGPVAARRLKALVEADFDTQACGPDVLPLWYAFWGELRAQQEYHDIADGFEQRRSAVLCDVWQNMWDDCDAAEAARLAHWTERLSDGYWLQLHLDPDEQTAETACLSAKAALARLAPRLHTELGWG
ncbi:MAG: TetR family transcriptional regulator [Pseudomonadota bacterium]